MFSRIQERFGTAGLVVAVIALIAVLGGTAYAASGGLTSKQKKEVKKIAKSFQGKGPTGPQGPAGSNGTNGTNGKDGAPGAPGAPGKSVVSEEEEPGLNCEAGGYSFEVEDSGETNYVCNGTGGSGGGGGSQGVLASGETETGVWSFRGKGQEIYWVDINFPLLVFPKVEVVGNAEGDPTNCPGSLYKPEAEPGYLCLYRQEKANALRGLVFPLEDVDWTGAGFVDEWVAQEAEQEAYGRGTWAVTAK